MSRGDRQLVDLRGQQPRSKFRDIQAHGGTLNFCGLTLGERGVVSSSRREDRIEGGELLAGAFHRVVCLGEVVEVADDVAHPARRIARFEHVVAHEVVEVAHGLHGHRLVEEFQRLLGANAEETPQGGRVFRILVEDLGSGGPQPPS